MLHSLRTRSLTADSDFFESSMRRYHAVLSRQDALQEVTVTMLATLLPLFHQLLLQGRFTGPPRHELAPWHWWRGLRYLDGESSSASRVYYRGHLRDRLCMDRKGRLYCYSANGWLYRWHQEYEGWPAESVALFLSERAEGIQQDSETACDILVRALSSIQAV